MNNSRLEQTLDYITTQLQGISTSDGYRTDPLITRYLASIDNIPQYPCIMVESGNGEVKPLDTNMTLFDMFVPIALTCFIEGSLSIGDENNLENKYQALLHDVQRIVASLMLSQVTAQNRFNMNPDKRAFQFTGLFPMGNMPKGWFTVSFMIQIRNVGRNFDD